MKHQVLLVIEGSTCELYLVSGESKVEEYEAFASVGYSINGKKVDERQAARDVFDLLYQCLQQVAHAAR